MTTSSPPLPPSSFDPALHLHSESGDPLPATDSFGSDDLEALNLQTQELISQKTRQGIVIQHRAWNLPEVFKSNEDFQQPHSPSKSQQLLPKSTSKSNRGPFVPSSPPRVNMNLVSSPIAYPPSSSPPPMLQKRKQNDASKHPEPKKRRLAGFLVDDEDDAEDTVEENLGHSKAVGAEFEVNIQSSTIENNSYQEEIDQAPTSSPAPSAIPKKSLLGKRLTILRTCSGKSYPIMAKAASTPVPYEKMVAERSITAPGRAQKSYYGVDIHGLVDDAKREIQQEKERVTERVPPPSTEKGSCSERPRRSTMWTEKYRARKFTDLVGDERTHRSVLRWLKSWDPVVFPGLANSRLKKKMISELEEKTHRKVLLLTGPPGLGKTTLAHVCARQAGYEVLEINASDERSRDIVKGRIRDAVGTENVKGVNVETSNGKVRKAGRPVCVVVDEVDGVVGGSGAGGEGGFMKALIDLVLLDQKNSNNQINDDTNSSRKRNKKGDKFRLLRPLILICNDVYHPSLRPLRSSTIAEIVHVRKAPLDKVIQRMKDVFEREGIPSDSDAVRRLCENTWGIGGRKEGRAGSRGSGEGDIRGVLVAGEWLAHKLRASNSSRLTRNWVERQLRGEFAASDTTPHGLCRGGVREIIERVFLDGAGFPNPAGSSTSHASKLNDPYLDTTSQLNPSNLRKRYALYHLREMVDTTGDHDRCVTECFTQYPSQTFQDDTFLSKPNAVYDWLNFHDLASGKVHSQQEWELMPYLSHSVLAFHHLFAAVGKHAWDSEKGVFDRDGGHENDDEPSHPFSGPRADYAAYEAEREHRSILTSFHSSLPASLIRSFRSPDIVATDLLPQVIRMLAPDIKPVVVGGGGENRGIASVRKESEKTLVRHGARVMHRLGITFERTRVEYEVLNPGGGGWIFRMEPPLDNIVSFTTSTASSLTTPPVRYAIRQVLDQEYRTVSLLAQASAREARYRHGNDLPDTTADDDTKENNNPLDKTTETASSTSTVPAVKRDFFGRILVNSQNYPHGKSGRPKSSSREDRKDTERLGGKDEKIWLHYHEGFNNAVRKPITMAELMSGL